jgi:hypothetical protein
MDPLCETWNQSAPRLGKPSIFSTLRTRAVRHWYPAPSPRSMFVLVWTRRERDESYLKVLAFVVIHFSASETNESLASSQRQFFWLLILRAVQGAFLLDKCKANFVHQSGTTRSPGFRPMKVSSGKDVHVKACPHEGQWYLWTSILTVQLFKALVGNIFHFSGWRCHPSRAPTFADSVQWVFLLPKSSISWPVFFEGSEIFRVWASALDISLASQYEPQLDRSDNYLTFYQVSAENQRRGCQQVQSEGLKCSLQVLAINKCP